MSAVLDQTRREWEDGNRRFEEEVRESGRAELLLAELDLVTAELRRRIGQTFTLGELAAAYATAERWARAAVDESEPAPGWPRRLSLVTDAAFYRFSRGAVDYTP